MRSSQSCLDLMDQHVDLTPDPQVLLLRPSRAPQGWTLPVFGGLGSLSPDLEANTQALPCSSLRSKRKFSKEQQQFRAVKTNRGETPNP